MIKCTSFAVTQEKRVNQMNIETANEQNSSLVKELLSAINSLRFGSVEITVHEGRVTQIEKREKVRFTDSANTPIKPTANTAAKTLKVSNRSDR